MIQTKKEFLNIWNVRILKKVVQFAVLYFLLIYATSCKKSYTEQTIKISDSLQLTKLTDHSYIHTSFIKLENGTEFPCNGFIYINQKESYIFDSPASDMATIELIDWLQNKKKATIKGVVFNHFHNDCVQGIEIFQKENISTIGSKKTSELLRKDGYPEPNLIFTDHLKLKLGTKEIINTFMGEAHTSDNIVSFFPDENILFGGCMIKSIGARKGNLKDANINEWSQTVANIKKTYPSLETVIPGHGKHGNTTLLDYTIKLFKDEN